mmetsp:Transcript_12002/g.19913  ORF Transcript_12002/g.19913 Transcript_12002/m.19913 type:complete len:311 (+) Transcript_12002:64-996(+)
MNVEKQLTPATHSHALSKMLLHSDGPTSIVSSSSFPAKINEDPSTSLSLLTVREALRQALYCHEEPVLMPLDYLQQFCQDDLEGNVAVVVNDTVLGQKFHIVPVTNNPATFVHHANLQRLYGYCNDPSYMVLEDLPKGTVSTLLENRKGRVQLGAQRRIQIMLDVAKVLSFLQEQGRNDFLISSSNIGLTLDLNPKLMRSKSKDDADNVYDFGILMMELLTGTLQNNQSQDNQYGDFAERYLTKGGPIIEDDLDPYVRTSWTFSILSQLVELAMSCIGVVKKRPSPEKLVDTLTLISARMHVAENYDFFG